VTFWDSSALVPLIVEEPRSKACRALQRTHRGTIVWVLTRTELVSAVHRLARDRMLDRADVPEAMRRIDAMERRWSEITAVDLVRDRAERALAVHPLRAADAMQLGAALVHCEDKPKRRRFITADGVLAAAATAEGFEVIVPNE
jgi:predicted nucleic acid-binding protein